MVNANVAEGYNISTFISEAQDANVQIPPDLRERLFKAVDFAANTLEAQMRLTLLHIYLRHPWDYWGTLIEAGPNEDYHYTWSIDRFIDTLVELLDMCDI